MQQLQNLLYTRHYKGLVCLNSKMCSLCKACSSVVWLFKINVGTDSNDSFGVYLQVALLEGKGDHNYDRHIARNIIITW